MNFIYQFVLSSSSSVRIIVYRLSVLPAAAAADSPDTERRSGRPHHFPIRLFHRPILLVHLLVLAHSGTNTRLGKTC